MAKRPTKGGGDEPERQPQPEHEPKRPAEQQGGERTRSRRTFRPAVDIYEVENGLMLLADVPGAPPEGVTITLERRVLSIHAQAAEHAPEAYSLVYQEYEVGDFECQFTLSVYRPRFVRHRIDLTQPLPRVKAGSAARRRVSETRVVRSARLCCRSFERPAAPDGALRRCRRCAPRAGSP